MFAVVEAAEVELVPAGLRSAGGDTVWTYIVLAGQLPSADDDDCPHNISSSNVSLSGRR